jgi:hypothetical protein
MVGVAIIPANAALPFFKKSRLEMSAISKEKIKLLVIIDVLIVFAESHGTKIQNFLTSPHIF